MLLPFFFHLPLLNTYAPSTRASLICWAPAPVAVFWFFLSVILLGRHEFHEKDTSGRRSFQCTGGRGGLPGEAHHRLRAAVPCRPHHRPHGGARAHQVKEPHEGGRQWCDAAVYFTVSFTFSFFYSRFLFLLLGPHGKGPQYHEIGRSMATLMTDEVSGGKKVVWFLFFFFFHFKSGLHWISTLLCRYFTTWHTRPKTE